MTILTPSEHRAIREAVEQAEREAAGEDRGRMAVVAWAVALLAVVFLASLGFAVGNALHLWN